MKRISWVTDKKFKISQLHMPNIWEYCMVRSQCPPNSQRRDIIIFRGNMPSNITRIVCDIVPLWSGYMWGAQVMTRGWHVMMLSPTLGRGHLWRLLPVPGHSAPLPRLLLRLPLSPDHAGGQQQHRGQGEETWVVWYWEECHFRIDSKVSGFNRRVESVILHLRSKEFQNQVNDFTEGRWGYH